MHKLAIWGIVILFAGLIYFLFNPADNILFPKCPFFVLTGLKCPGCGSQRAIHCLLHLEVIKALHFNTLLILTLPFAILLLIAEFYRTTYPNFYIKVHKKKYIWIYFSVVILWWIIRNIFDF